jgi:hypothetical protein
VEIPASMQVELAQWNNGAGISLESWVGCGGRFELAVGYSCVFWPEFVEFEGYILRKGFSVESLRGFEGWGFSTAESVERTMNHLHISDIQHVGCPDISKDKIIFLGTLLKEIYEVKLKWQFPHRPCVVSFWVPEDEDEDDLDNYQITFWQPRETADDPQGA